MKNKILIVMLMFLFPFATFGQDAVDVTDQTIKIKGDEELYFGFAQGDKIIFNFREIDNKEFKEIEIVEYPNNSKFSDFKTSKIENKTLTVTKQAAYIFRFKSGGVGGKICKVQIQRIPASEATRDFNTTINWITKQDTTWNSYTKDIVVGYDTAYLQNTKKELVRIDTSVTELFSKTEQIGNEDYSSLNVYLPENSYSPNQLSPYQSKEVIAWSYWLGTDKQSYESANQSLSKGIGALATLSGYGALANLAITGVSLFSNPTNGSNVKYSFIAMQNGQQFTFDSGDGVAANGRNEKLLQGTFTIRLYNDNVWNDINVTVKVIAVQVSKTWEDKQYTEQKVNPKYEKQIFTEPNVRTYKVPTLGQ